jgi:hypothetical protein
MRIDHRLTLGAGVAIAGALLGACEPRSGSIQDEARRAGRAAQTLAAADEDYFKDMDGGAKLTPEEVKGRNTWLVWTGGNDRLWDTLSVASVGNLDFLKVLSSHPSITRFSRDNRWRYFGLVNEPCFEKATGARQDRFGLWLDVRRADCAPDPFENDAKYPGVALGARGRNLPQGSYYGYATGIVGLRLFPNPDFDEKAKREWDPERFYNDPSYYQRSDLVRPYRVGMSCAFCHVGPNPVNPPADAEHPAWSNLSSNVGAQYFWIDRIFIWDHEPRSERVKTPEHCDDDRGDRNGRIQCSFAWQLFHTSRPGALDTSLVSSDNINNPRTMNAIYQLMPRLQQALRWGRERLAHGSLDNRQFNDFVESGLLTHFFTKPDIVQSPRVLKDGSDSVGALGALNRVYLNIGLFSEEWLTHFHPLVGGKATTPIEIKVARENSAYWEATEAQTPDLALFFLRTTGPHRLKDAPGGAAYLNASAEQLHRGKVVFAENCARCHSSKLPATAAGLDPNGCSGSGYLACFDRYWKWTASEEFKSQMRDIVLKDDFLEDNFLSAEFRVPVTLLHTNACSPLATNALEGNIWDNFSSQTYKELPSVGDIRYYHPVTGEAKKYRAPGGGRGYTRPASLVSLWSTAPYLLNNSVGHFEESPSVEARMRAFNDGIEQMLWPEKRERDRILGDKVPGMMDRTTARSFLQVPRGYVPESLQFLIGPVTRASPWLANGGGLAIGPIPRDTPVNLVANLDLLSERSSLGDRIAGRAKMLELLKRAKGDLEAIPPGADDDTVRKGFANLVEPMLEMSKCPDFVVNRGHYFGTGYVEPGASPQEAAAVPPGLPDADKRALIEFLKTF